MTKINNLYIKGIRGVKKEIELPLNGKSILIYGENGSGKSSITDALEWFYFDKVDHLVSEEIGRKGLEALRNIHIDDSEDGLVKIEYSDSNLNSSKKISQSNSKISTECTNNSQDFISFIDKSESELLFLRYRDLVSFILATKTEKLNALSGIIGFSEVIKIRDVFKRTLNSIKREIKNSGFGTQIAEHQKELIEQLHQNVTTDNQYISAINNLIGPLKTDKKVETFDDLDDVIKLLRKPEDEKIVEQQLFLKHVRSTITQLTTIVKNIENQYVEYYLKYKNIVTDIDKLNKIKLETLLSEGLRVIKEEIIKDELCPLCLQPKKRIELLKEIQDRIEELEKVKKERTDLDQLKSDLQSQISKSENLINGILSNTSMELEDNKLIKSFLIKVNKGLKKFESEANTDILSGQILTEISKLSIDKNDFKELDTITSKSIDKIQESRKGDDKSIISDKIMFSRKAYLDINRLKKSKELLEKQQYTLEKITSDFIQKMETGFKAFLNHLSRDINELYTFMNPGEPIEDIELIPIEKDGDFAGITIQFKFYDNYGSPPNKYLSESHLNCLGIAYFLTSVKALNENNKFFILDDTISSFDANHRIGFAQLLIEKFSDYQVILLTHDQDWFNFVSRIVKGRNWIVKEIKWEEKNGPFIDNPLPTLKDRIEKQISSGILENLGNNIRKYLERVLKEIAFYLPVHVRFLFNDKNENRMANELLTALKSSLNKHIDNSIDISVIDRLLTSNCIGNIDSHDSSFMVTMGDCKVFWNDVMKLSNLFFCRSCEKCISNKYYDQVNRKIRCKCGNIKYKWKK